MKLLLVVGAAAEWVSGIALTGVLAAYGAIIMLYSKVADHEKDPHRHVDSADVVTEKICAARVDRIESLVAQSAKDISEIKEVILSNHKSK